MVRAAPPAHYGWLTERTGYLPGSGFRAIEVLGADGRVRGMAGFDGWTPAAARMHVAVDAAGACRGLLRAAFEYLFGETGRRVALATIREGNTRSLRLAKHLGFVERGRTRDGWDVGEALVHLELRREDCRWRQGT